MQIVIFENIFATHLDTRENLWYRDGWAYKDAKLTGTFVNTEELKTLSNDYD